MSKLTHELPDRFSNPNTNTRYWIVKAIEDALEEQSLDIGDAKNQYFFSTSSGVYLLRLATRYGMDFENSDIYTPNLLRTVAPLVAYQPQCTRSTLWKVLHSFYDSNYVHTNIYGAQGNFNLTNKDFTVEVDGVRESITFLSDRFDDSSNATIDEVIQLYNQSIKNSKMYKVKTPNGELIALRSNKVGYSRVKVISGTANTEFLLTDIVNPNLPELSITKQLSPYTTIEWVSSEDSLFYQLSVGDVLTIKSDILSGGFEVVKVEDNKVTVLSELAAGTYSVTPESFFFILNKEYNLYDNDLFASIDEASSYNNVFFTLPAVAPIHSEDYITSWYGWNDSYGVTSFDRNGVFIDESIQIGSVRFVFENQNVSFDSGNLISGLGDVDGYVKCTMPYSTFTKINTSAPMTVSNSEIIVKCDHEHKLYSGVQVEFQGDFTGTYNVKRVISSTSFSFSFDEQEESVVVHSIRSTTTFGLQIMTPYSVSDTRKFIKGNKIYIPSLNEHAVVSDVTETEVFLHCDCPPTNKVLGTDLTVIKTLNITSSNIEYKVDSTQYFFNNMRIIIFQGEKYMPSYIYDKHAEFTTLSQYGTLIDSVYANTQTQIKISSQYILPAKGSIVVDFMSNKQEVLQYSSIVKISTSTWLIHVEPNQLLKYDHKRGGVVRLITEDEVVKYKTPYIVSTSDKRNECVRILEQVVAAGVEISPDVVYPDIKNEDFSIRILR